MRQFLTIEDVKVGDVVRLVGSKALGTITKLYSQKVEIDFDGRTTNAYPAEVEVVKPEDSKPAPAPFKAGQRVIVTDKNDSRCGLRGTVVRCLYSRVWQDEVVAAVGAHDTMIVKAYRRFYSGVEIYLDGTRSRYGRATTGLPLWSVQDEGDYDAEQQRKADEAATAEDPKVCNCPPTSVGYGLGGQHGPFCDTLTKPYEPAYDAPKRQPKPYSYDRRGVFYRYAHLLEARNIARSADYAGPFVWDYWPTDEYVTLRTWPEGLGKGQPVDTRYDGASGIEDAVAALRSAAPASGDVFEGGDWAPCQGCGKADCIVTADEDEAMQGWCQRCQNWSSGPVAPNFSAATECATCGNLHRAECPACQHSAALAAVEDAANRPPTFGLVEAAEEYLLDSLLAESEARESARYGLL